MAPRGSPWLPTQPMPIADYFPSIARSQATAIAFETRSESKSAGLAVPHSSHHSPGFPLPGSLGSFSSQNIPDTPASMAMRRRADQTYQTESVEPNCEDQSLNPWNLALLKSPEKNPQPIHNTKTLVRAMSC